MADIPDEPFQMFFTCTPLDAMRPVEKSRLLRALADWARLRPSASGANALHPTNCKTSLALGEHRPDRDGDDGDVVGDAARVPRKRTKCTPTPSAATADTPAPATSTEAVRPARLSGLTDQERLFISHDVWCTDLNE